ncbi:MerR family transcriptional regulator [Planotetraspora kaengkrachanensis]|uniref:MerR family transcriptional regulator n=1 Tax=Planotetraspora kaengkrachanensis TaxID=575193 RepID=A0A8J3VAR5_9ACTN|nr:MerR family transcriptional regulator [Planotetraspora kaengkrachanensis]GIG84190.1 MerR family transcriptional regulator [Planotetraspora kaengkrachanensis]
MDEGTPEAGGTPIAGEEPGYGIGAVARRLGVPAPTLRTWNLRYGIGPSRRSPGGHRRYDAADLRCLEEMNRLIHAGVAPADAARQAFRVRRPAAGARAEAAIDDPVPEPPAAPPDGGILSPAMLARAAIALDARTVGDAVEAALDRHGVVRTWEGLVLPTFELITRRQEDTGLGIEVEHLFSDRLMGALNLITGRLSIPVHPRPVLVACAEEEQHSLPAYALAAALAERRVETRVLGARTPYSALAEAMRRLGPAVVFVWSQQAETGDPDPLGRLPRLRPASRILVGGPGWRDGLPPKASLVTSLPGAISAVMSALR